MVVHAHYSRIQAAKSGRGFPRLHSKSLFKKEKKRKKEGGREGGIEVGTEGGRKEEPSGFQIMSFPRCTFPAPRLLSFAHFLTTFLISVACSALCLFPIGVYSTILFTLICGYNYPNRFMASFQAITSNAKWNAFEAGLCSILLELADHTLSFS